jgi:hypothetical protein
MPAGERQDASGFFSPAATISSPGAGSWRARRSIGPPGSRPTCTDSGGSIHLTFLPRNSASSAVPAHQLR